MSSADEICMLLPHGFWTSSCTTPFWESSAHWASNFGRSASVARPEPAQNTGCIRCPHMREACHQLTTLLMQCMHAFLV